MGAGLKDTVKKLLAARGLAVSQQRHLADLRHRALLGEKARSLGFVDDAHLRPALDLLAESPSQLNQDLFALQASGWKQSGYFVEFGATDGRTLSNTWLLEKHFGWTGILAEPARKWRDVLSAAGRSAALEFDCVWERTGDRLAFAEAEEGELSTLATFRARDHHDRRAARTYDVPTVSLIDMLERHGAPAEIDYLSIDTEGSELAILEAFDFGRFRFGCITVEHNYTADRERIHDLLASHGYRRAHAELSRFDDWYVARA